MSKSGILVTLNPSEIYQAQCEFHWLPKSEAIVAYARKKIGQLFWWNADQLCVDPREA